MARRGRRKRGRIGIRYVISAQTGGLVSLFIFDRILAAIFNTGSSVDLNASTYFAGSGTMVASMTPILMVLVIFTPILVYVYTALR